MTKCLSIAKDLNQTIPLSLHIEAVNRAQTLAGAPRLNGESVLRKAQTVKSDDLKARWMVLVGRSASVEYLVQNVRRLRGTAL